MREFLILLHVITSVLLVVVILMQASRGGGLSGTFGSATSTAIFGGRGAGSFLSKITVGLTIAFMALAVLISLINVPSGSTSIIGQRAEDQVTSPAAELPVPLSLPQEEQ